MNPSELRNLSDAELSAKISVLEPATKHRTPEGGISEQAATALGALLPFKKEQDRRKAIADSQKRSKTLADLDEAMNEKQEQTRRLFRLCGNSLN